MSKNYYYLVSGLPEVTLDGSKKFPGVSEFVAEVKDELCEEDAKLLELLLYYYDNKNLVSIIEKDLDKVLEHIDPEFDTRGNFSRDELEREVKFPDLVPDYMKNYIEARKEGVSLFPGYTFDDQLSWLYYDSVSSHENAFIKDWFSFELNLRNVLAGLNFRKMSKRSRPQRVDPNDSNNIIEDTFALGNVVIGRNDVADLIQKSNAPDFSVSSVFPWVEKLLAIDSSNLIEWQKNVDMLRWDALNEFTTFTYFQVETVLAFCIKLGIVERWQKLDPALGQEAANRLLAELRSGVKIS